jgi:predicted nucleic acid-binding protein
MSSDACLSSLMPNGLEAKSKASRKPKFCADTALGEHYAEQFPRLKEAGTPLGANDFWIVCHALAKNAGLVTNNVRQFEMVIGLQTENQGFLEVFTWTEFLAMQ